MQDGFFDINRFPSNGKIVLFLSMSRLFLGQNAKNTYEEISHFFSKMIDFSIDFYCIYTNGLYFNSEAQALLIRQRTTNQMLQHCRELKSLILSEKKIPLKAIHFLTWDSLILGSSDFLEMQFQLFKLHKEDTFFRNLIEITAKEESNLSHIKFVLEETAVTYLLRQKKIPLPSFLSDEEAWRLITYAGNSLLPDVYLARHPSFKTKKAFTSQFHQSCYYGMYNTEKRIFVDYNHVLLRKKENEFLC